MVAFEVWFVGVKWSRQEESNIPLNDFCLVVQNCSILSVIRKTRGPLKEISLSEACPFSIV